MKGNNLFHHFLSILITAEACVLVHPPLLQFLYFNCAYFVTPQNDEKKMGESGRRLTP